LSAAIERQGEHAVAKEIKQTVERAMTGIELGRRVSMMTGALLFWLVQQPTPSAAAEHVTVMTDFPPVPMHAALYIAETKGWFKDAGAEVEIQDGKGSGNTIQLVGAGQVEIGYVELGPLMPAREAGMKIRSIAEFTRQPDLGIVYDAKLGAITPKDLAGKPILCFAGSFWTPFIKPFFTAAGVDFSTVSILNVDVNAMYSSYMSGKADAVMTSPPYGVPLVQAVRPARSIMAMQYGIILPGYGLVVAEDGIRSHSEIFAKIAKATARGWQYLLDGHEDEGIQAIQKIRPDVKLDPAMAREQLKGFERLVYTDTTKGKAMGWQSEADWVAGMQTAERAGLIKAGHKPAEFYTNALLEASQ
jgi:NitT/TauT family transport system substrate-binding protein